MKKGTKNPMDEHDYHDIILSKYQKQTSVDIDELLKSQSSLTKLSVINYSENRIQYDLENYVIQPHMDYLRVASNISKYSHANRVKVGCVITTDGFAVSFGYNQMPPFYDVACESNGISNPEVVHAEIVAINKMTTTCKNSILYCTHAPCIECAKSIVMKDINEIYFSRIWENYVDGIKLLVNCRKIIKQIYIPNV